jgi:hypothetical protein
MLMPRSVDRQTMSAVINEFRSIHLLAPAITVISASESVAQLLLRMWRDGAGLSSSSGVDSARGEILVSPEPESSSCASSSRAATRRSASSVVTMGGAVGGRV